MIVLLNVARTQQVIRQRVEIIDTLTEVILATLVVQANLHEHLGNNVHDKVSGVITINERDTQWNGFALSMTERP